MASSPDSPELSDRELADLSALADGTLDPERRAEVQAWVAASSELSALYARERRVVELLHQARARDRAPEALRARLEQQQPRRRTAVRRRAAYGTAFAGALAAVVLALVLLLPSGTPGAPSLSEAAALATRGPANAAPGPDPSAPGLRLNQSMGDLYFPNWTASFGWEAVGMRTDDIRGREAVTVYYARQGGSPVLAYTIVASPPLTNPSARTTSLYGTELRTLTVGGRLVVTWRRSGHTCLISATDVKAPELQRLAAWKVPAGDR